MSQTIPIAAVPGAAAPDVKAAIARASTATGVDFQYLLAQARLESGLDPSARAATSSAAGLYQFTKGTWLQTLERHGAEHGLPWADAAIDQGRVRDPALRGQILALRFDPQVSALMAGELAGDNAAHLTAVLGRAPNAAELYLAHFLGAAGAGKFLTALSADPGQSAAALLPEAASANRAVFFGRGGAPRSVGAVMDLMRAKMAVAMRPEGAPGPPEGEEGWRTTAIAASGRLPQPLPGAGESTRPSMAETLRLAFGADQGGAEPQVRAAYAKLRAFGL